MIQKTAVQFGLIDKPGERKIHSSPIPTGGGLGIGFGVLITFAIGQLLLILLSTSEKSSTFLLASFVPDLVNEHWDGLIFRSRQLWILLGLGNVLLILGTLDDKWNLSWKLRIFVQTLVAIIAVACGWQFTLFMDIPILTGFLSVIWIVGLINAFNMLDNMNGLSAGVAAICTSFLAAVMFLSPNPESSQPQLFVAGFLFILLSSISGFLVWNNPFRATLFMGDGGAYFIGFLLATMTLGATFSSYEAPERIFAPFLILAVPIYDMTTVLLIRTKNGKSLFVGDKNHLSHRLVDLGFSQTQAVLLIYLLTASVTISSLLLYQVSFWGATLICIQTFFLLFFIGMIEFAGRK
ncbi:MAG: MraY family glycosyltransferase [Thermoguttaceae bacterium]